MSRLIVSLFLVVGCAARVPFGAFPGDPLPKEILEGWAEAQEELLELEPPLASDPRRVSPHWFTWIEQTRRHRCVGPHPTAAGCFTARTEDHIIQYVNKKEIIVHEALHAIAFAAGDERWRTIPHRGNR